MKTTGQIFDEQEPLEYLLQQIELVHHLKEMDNRKLLWLAMNTQIWKKVNVASLEAEILAEIENRMYPEFDGEHITFEQWGWKTPNDEIRYL